MSIHFNGSDENIELFLRTVTSANQLSVYRAIADLCNELPKDLRARERNLQHLIIWKRWRFLVAFLLKKLRPMHSNGETWCNNTSEKSSICQKTRNHPNYVLMRVLKLVETGQYFYTLDTEERLQMEQLCREYTML